jgi:hypothetical protein
VHQECKATVASLIVPGSRTRPGWRVRVVIEFEDEAAPAGASEDPHSRSVASREYPPNHDYWIPTARDSPLAPKTR